jgi:hypothetical protein
METIPIEGRIRRLGCDEGRQRTKKCENKMALFGASFSIREIQAKALNVIHIENLPQRSSTPR